MSNKGKEIAIAKGLNPKGKGKKTEMKGLNPYVRKSLSFQEALNKSEQQLKGEILSQVPEEDKLRDDAYSIAAVCTSAKEYIYPYIPITTLWIAPIERKHFKLTAEEVMTFYLRNFTDPFLYPKDYFFYQEILVTTKSVVFDSTGRSGGELAYSKALINKVISPEEWGGDWYKYKDVSTRPNRSISFNYFDYIKAWEIAFCFTNSQRKHSWFFRFGEQRDLNFPQWFIIWFSNWGLYPLILPKRVRSIYDEFVATNTSLSCPGLIFTVLYQVPWIIKWDVIITPRTMKKNDVVISEIPYLGREIFSKWWDKFSFFEDSVFSKRGLINLQPAPIKNLEPEKEAKDIIAGILSGNKALAEILSGNKALRSQLKALLGSDDEEEKEATSEDSTSKKGSTGGGIDTEMQEAQDPNEL